MAPLWVGWILVVHWLFRWRLTRPLRGFAFNHGPDGLRRAYIWVGSSQNPDTWSWL